MDYITPLEPLLLFKIWQASLIAAPLGDDSVCVRCFGFNCRSRREAWKQFFFIVSLAVPTNLPPSKMSFQIVPDLLAMKV